MKTALKILAAGLFLLAGCDAALALDTNLAQRIDAEVQTAGMQSLPDLTWLQGSTPAVEVRILRNGKATALSTNVECRMLISSNLYTGTNYAQVTNTVLTTNSTASSMWLQWPTIGTNSCPSNSNTAAAEWHLYKENRETCEKVRELRHDIQHRKPVAEERWDELLLSINSMCDAEAEKILEQQTTDKKEA